MTEQADTRYAAGREQNGDGVVGAGSAVVANAAVAVGARHGTTEEVAYAMLCGLARSQGRDLDEYAGLVVAGGGRLDV